MFRLPFCLLVLYKYIFPKSFPKWIPAATCSRRPSGDFIHESSGRPSISAMTGFCTHGVRRNELLL